MLYLSTYHRKPETLRQILRLLGETRSRAVVTAHVNYRNSEYGDTALHAATELECAEVLLEYGADASQRNLLGETPLDCCDDENVAVLLRGHMWETSLRAAWVTACVV